jgi:hypothetical protein
MSGHGAVIAIAIVWNGMDRQTDMILIDDLIGLVFDGRRTTNDDEIGRKRMIYELCIIACIYMHMTQTIIPY